MNGLDQTVFLWLNLGATASPKLVEVARLASLQLPHWMIAATLAVALAGRPAGRPQAWRVLLSMALAAVAAALLKHGFQHARPFALGLGTQCLPHGKSAGFPSSHATAAMAFAVSAALAPVRWPARRLVGAAALALSWSRIALGLHFPSDVLAAWRAPVCSTFCSHQSCVSAKPCAVPNQRASGRSSALASQASASARAAAVQARKRVKVSVGGCGMGGPRAGWATRERHGKAPA